MSIKSILSDLLLLFVLFLMVGSIMIGMSIVIYILSWILLGLIKGVI